MCGEYTRSYHHPGAQFWVGSRRNWSVILERPITGRHENAPVRCPCSRLAALHGAPRTLYVMLYVVLVYLMLFAALSNAICLHNASFFAIDLCK